MNRFAKTIATITLGATLLFTSVTSASAATYTVKSGDTLSKIARDYGTTYKQIMAENGLTSTLIKVGQTLQIGGATPSTPVTQAPAAPTTSNTTYTVVKGDTLSKIAQKYGTTYTAIMQLNGLTSTVIKVGQKLQVTGTSISASTPTTNTSTNTVVTNPTQSSSNTDLVNFAKSLLGVPYSFGGASTKGFDCSGFVYYVLKNSGKNVTRTSAAGFYNKATKVTNPQVGDLVFFSNTYKAGISHVGIYIGNGQMIGASGSKVNIASINSSYWKSHFTGYGRI